MRNPTYLLQSLESVFYFRMRVPTDLQPFFNRSELKKSLRTKSKTQALRRCRQYVAAAERVFESLRVNNFKAELKSSKCMVPSAEHVVNGQYRTPPTIREREKELWDKIFTAEPIGRNNDLPRSTQDSVCSLGNDKTPPVLLNDQPVSLSELINLYISEVTDQRGQDIARGIEKNLTRFMEIVTDKPINQYTVEDKLRYRDVLQRMPKCIHRKAYYGMTIDEIVSVERPANELLSVKTVNMRLIEVATLFNWAVTNTLIDSHPFKKAVLKIQKSDDAERPAISDADIKVIVENLPRDASEPSKFWIPLIACFTGMRQSEIAQLDGDDIINVDGTWCIDVNDRGDKRLKNSNAKRIVPLHTVLIDAGLVVFAERRRGLKLFEDVTPYKGKYGHQVSKYFSKYLTSIGVGGNGQTFHV